MFGKDKLPSWVNEVLTNVTFIRHNVQELIGEKAEDPFLSTYTKEMEWRDEFDHLNVSMPERAFLELLMDVPQKISFEDADQLIQGLTTLSPRRLQALLEQCANIKVARLLF